METEGNNGKMELKACPFGGSCPRFPIPGRSGFHAARKKPLQVLMYHRVCPDNEVVTSRYVVRKSTLRRQMEFLILHGFCTPTISSILCGATENCNAGRHPIIITFDDGYLDTYENAFPIFQEFGLSPIVFVIADFSRSVNSWDHNGDLHNMPLLRPDHLRVMSKSGIQFGIHSFTHPSLPGLSDADLDRELTLGKSSLEAITHQSSPTIAYPFGDVDDRVKIAAKRAGYQCAFSSYSGPLKHSTDLYEIRRIFMTDRSSRIYLIYKASGLDHLLRWGVWYLKQLVGIGNRSHQGDSAGH